MLGYLSPGCGFSGKDPEFPGAVLTMHFPFGKDNSMKRRPGGKQLHRPTWIILLHDRDPPYQFVPGQELPARVRLELTPLRTLALLQHRQDERVPVADEFERGVERALTYQCLPHLLSLPGRHPDAPLRDRHPDHVYHNSIGANH